MPAAKPGTWVQFTCDHCGAESRKRHDHIAAHNYCSRACNGAAQRVEGAKWRDPVKVAEYMRDYNQRNRERLVKQKAEYRRAHPEVKATTQRKRREQLKKGDFTSGDWEAVKKAHGYSCLACGKREPAIKLTADHIVPLLQGGAHTASNIQPLCHGCNRRKSTRQTDYRKELNQ